MKRFWSKVNKTSECWEWTASVDKDGYGWFSIGGQSMGAHRAVLVLGGLNVQNQCVLHKCDNRKCVRPSHLLLGDRAMNARDMVAKGRSLKGDKGPARIHRHRMRRGENHPKCKVPDATIRELKKLSRAGMRNKEISIQLGLTQTYVSIILKGYSRREVE